MLHNLERNIKSVERRKVKIAMLFKNTNKELTAKSVVSEDLVELTEEEISVVVGGISASAEFHTQNDGVVFDVGAKVPETTFLKTLLIQGVQYIFPVYSDELTKG